MCQSRKLLLHAFSINALQFFPLGRKLKMGRLSPYFFDSGLFSSGESLSLLAQAYTAQIARNEDLFFGIMPDVIYGHPYKGIPLATAISMTLGNVGYAFSRKEEKNHGEGGFLVGASMRDKNVVIADDVMTTGTSGAEAVEIVKNAGGHPIGCVIAFDRQERGLNSELSAVQEFQKQYNIPVRAATTLEKLIGLLQETPEKYKKILPQILDYRTEYGVKP